MIKVEDKITCTIEEDGTITVVTDKVSKENHLSAEQMLNETFETLGGEVKKVKRPHGAGTQHSHIHGHVHTH
jgi:hypothetical protein